MFGRAHEAPRMNSEPGRVGALGPASLLQPGLAVDLSRAALTFVQSAGSGYLFDRFDNGLVDDHFATMDGGGLCSMEHANGGCRQFERSS
jgi:hypothetical protein